MSATLIIQFSPSGSQLSLALLPALSHAPFGSLSRSFQLSRCPPLHSAGRQPIQFSRPLARSFRLSLTFVRGLLLALSLFPLLTCPYQIWMPQVDLRVWAATACGKSEAVILCLDVDSTNSCFASTSCEIQVII